MSTGIVLAIVVAAVVVVALVTVAAVNHRRRARLRDRFGPEYDRAVEETGSRRAAEQDLDARERRYQELDIKPLPSGTREQYAQRWKELQEEFVDAPEGAVHEADRLVTALMHERGYPTEGYEQRMRDLSVRHGRTLEHYRAAQEVHALSSSRSATTEQLREAMVHYRALFDDLLTDDQSAGSRRS
ncbi:hypothetical protein ACFQ9J_22800 [Streptomyces sp. NPDC056529]|uniref:hypothetical protein n=1 Tax=Streptomyces sp. NPDC056529 TaxID=3345855 RepID=UPI0036911E17